MSPEMAEKGRLGGAAKRQREIVHHINNVNFI